MNIIVLGGAGLQGRAALQDLGDNSAVTSIICADVSFEGIDSFRHHLDMDKIEKQKIDASSEENLVALFSEDIDVLIDLLPKQYNETVARAAIKAGISLVNCSYANGLSHEIHEMAKENKVTIMPEAGLDPGIDLVLCGYGVSQLDEVYELYSYCGGIPEPDAADNPLKYKIAWNFDSTLMSYKRQAVMKCDGKIVDIPAEDQHNEEWLTDVTLSGIKGLESIPNGNAINFAKLLGIDKEVIRTERRTIRWSGHARFWRDMVRLGFLETTRVPELNSYVTPYDFLLKHLEKRLQYKEHEKDLVLMKNIIRGKKDGKDMEIIYSMVDKRDLKTGLFAMNRTVGYTASIVAQMIANKTITEKGLLSPTIDIPYRMFIDEIGKRGITIHESKRQLNKSLG
ncbi:Saccharopine dehydrogenase, NADP-dependent [Lentibacillus halodurans]|uniref:Saccharopine dehydrogenase, NADP-dependent n=1 Tax=Lentibacillus halodurans TaxID=237679 RepID=A0A1I0W4C6_9BACI|nr:saccharopine dehydrogenase C-terminal domain-containing protein [Lentibacillus halodurans]SFA83595.1 Saccharopine dehydrogenase, NADP-dependent [Lentibacillus halodurans]